MQPNRVKKILREGGLALGAYVGGIADPRMQSLRTQAAEARKLLTR